jgi:hypothetical protein
MASVPAGTAAQLARYAELFDIQLVGSESISTAVATMLTQPGCRLFPSLLISGVQAGEKAAAVLRWEKVGNDCHRQWYPLAWVHLNLMIEMMILLDLSEEKLGS